MRQTFLSLALLALSAISGAPTAALAMNAPDHPFRIVIDPGHGGIDMGTTYDAGEKTISEKEVTLALAREVARKLRAKGFSTHLTRSTDREVPLSVRTALANKLKADLFLSIHMNSTPDESGGAEGVETFILNNATDASSRRLAQLENVVLGQMNDASPEATDVALILKDLKLDANLSESKRLACEVQRNLVGATSRITGPTSARHRDRGVKQALFYVLLGAEMPSILVEAGFLSSARDRALVLSRRGQLAISAAIARAVESYKRSKDAAISPVSLNRCKVN